MNIKKKKVKVLQMGSPILLKQSKAVKNYGSKAVQELIDDLLSVCREKAESAGGLSAPQIGQNLRICVVRRVDIEEAYENIGKKIDAETNKKLWEVLINPKILKSGKKKSTFWEGCLSINEGDILGPVTRPSLVEIRYYDRSGKAKNLVATDFLAHIVQHELDHLEGVLFLEHVQNVENLWKNKELDRYIKKHGDFPDIV